MKISVSVPALALLIASCAIPVIGQQAASPQPQPKEQAKTVHLDDYKVAFKIRDAQHKADAILQTAQKYQRAIEQLSKEYTDQQKVLGDLQKEAFKSQGLSADDYDFNNENLDFTSKPAKTEQTPKPETNK